MADYVFDRVEELGKLRQRFQQRSSFLFHGPAGVGKTLLLKQAIRDDAAILYCGHSASSLSIFRQLAAALAQRGDPVVLAKLGGHPESAIPAKSAVAIRGIVAAALKATGYTVVLDHLGFASQALAATLKEVASWASTSVVAVARSAHMEDVGFLLRRFPDRSDRFSLDNFDLEVAAQFAREAANRKGLQAQNLDDFLQRAVEFSEGNPGAILAMLDLAGQARYRSEDHIKITPLYIDFRMKGESPTHG
ncbi:MAG TPA: hypothetical protein VNK82_00115 [Terriglobales bacterium]|nr:hypothetical protein [Terriglobales bacterium]